MPIEAHYSLDEVIEAQSKVIRHVLEFMDRNGRARRSRRGKYGALINGTRRVDAELRRVFDFDERLCLCCRRWFPARYFNRHPTGRAGLQARCKRCCKLAVIYGGRERIPPEVLHGLVRTGTKV